MIMDRRAYCGYTVVLSGVQGILLGQRYIHSLETDAYRTYHTQLIRISPIHGLRAASLDVGVDQERAFQMKRRRRIVVSFPYCVLGSNTPAD